MPSTSDHSAASFSTFIKSAIGPVGATIVTLWVANTYPPENPIWRYLAYWALIPAVWILAFLYWARRKWTGFSKPRKTASAIFAACVIVGIGFGSLLFHFRPSPPGQLVHSGNQSTPSETPSQPVTNPIQLPHFPTPDEIAEAIKRNERVVQTSTPLSPLIKEKLFSVLIPFNDGEGDPIPQYRPKNEPAHFASMALFYVRISQWAKSALDGRDKPKSVEDIDTLLQEVVRYHVFVACGELQSDRSGFEWNYKTGMKPIAIPALATPNRIDYPPKAIIENLSKTLMGRTSEIDYWKKTTDKFSVPAGSTVRFMTSKEGNPGAYDLQISNPAIYTLTFTVQRTLLLNNYGFLPTGFEADADTIKHTRTFNIAIKGKFEFKRTTGTDPIVQEQYIQWTDGLFNGLGKYFEE